MDQFTQSAEDLYIKAWTRRLYQDFDHIIFQHKVRLLPPVIQITDASSYWGLWNPTMRSISLTRNLILKHPWPTVIEILKHEMAHQYVTEVLKGRSAHGNEFQQTCKLLGVAPWAISATGELPRDIPDWRSGSRDPETERLRERVSKLLALAESSNEHESALAMEKVRQLYTRYNLQPGESPDETDYVYCVVSRGRKKISATESMILSIINRHFFVRVIYTDLYNARSLEEHKAAELLGRRENVVMAEYVWEFLLQKVESLWRSYQKEFRAPHTHKKSYQLGLLTGFRENLEAEAEKSLAGPECIESRIRTAGGRFPSMRDLIAVSDSQLTSWVSYRYPRLHSKRWGGHSGNRTVYEEGRRSGGKIVINKGIDSGPGRTRLIGP